MSVQIKFPCLSRELKTKSVRFFFGEKKIYAIWKALWKALFESCMFHIYRDCERWTWTGRVSLRWPLWNATYRHFTLQNFVRVVRHIVHSYSEYAQKFSKCAMVFRAALNFNINNGAQIIIYKKIEMNESCRWSVSDITCICQAKQAAIWMTVTSAYQGKFNLMPVICSEAVYNALLSYINLHFAYKRALLLFSIREIAFGRNGNS